MNRLRKSPRRAYTLVELMISMSTATVLMAGMGTSVYLANQAFRADNSAVAVRSDVAFTRARNARRFATRHRLYRTHH